MREKSTVLWQFVEIIAQRKLHSFVKECFRNELSILLVPMRKCWQSRLELLSWILIDSRVLQCHIQSNKVGLYSQWCRSCALPPSAVNPLTTETFTNLEFLFSVIWGKNGTFSKLGCCCWYTSAVYALRKTIREDFRPLLWQTTFSSVDPRILKIIFCRPFTPDNQVTVFSVSDYMLIRGAIFTVTENGTVYYITMGPKVHCESLFYRYKTSVHTIYCLIFNKTFLSINPVKVNFNGCQPVVL
jgi:hypothetical protein